MVRFSLHRFSVWPDRRSSPQASTVRWADSLSFTECRPLVKKFPDLHPFTPEQRSAKGSFNKRLGEIKRLYRRWAWLGDHTCVSLVIISRVMASDKELTARPSSVFVGFLPSIHSPHRLTAHMVSPDLISSYELEHLPSTAFQRSDPFDGGGLISGSHEMDGIEGLRLDEPWAGTEGDDWERTVSQGE